MMQALRGLILQPLQISRITLADRHGQDFRHVIGMETSDGGLYLVI
jgi:hypothetical protein